MNTWLWKGESSNPVWGYAEAAQPKFAGQTLRVQAPLKLKPHFLYKSIWVLSLLRFISGNIFCFFQVLKIVIFLRLYFLVNNPNIIYFACQNWPFCDVKDKMTFQTGCSKKKKSRKKERKLLYKGRVVVFFFSGCENIHFNFTS